MILKASQRAGATQLAQHLLNNHDNEHIEIHEISGFVAQDLQGALREIQALSRGTKCKQYMFSVSLNPPQTEIAPIEYFENAIAKIEEKTGLAGQSRVIVFHEKEGRRHAHVVWSRIKVEDMKAINLPYFKMKLQDISRQLFYQYGWQLPDGLRNTHNRNPLNYTLAEWQQAKRTGENPKTIKALFQHCWTISDSKQAFIAALKENGYFLAKGDKRGFVAVDYKGEIYSLSRWIGIKPKELKAKLGNPDDLPTIDQTKAIIAQHMTVQIKNYARQIKAEAKEKGKPLLKKKQALVKQHRLERETLVQKQADRQKQEQIARQHKLPKGLKSIWAKLTGNYGRIRQAVERDFHSSQARDRTDRQALIQKQLSQRQILQAELQRFKGQYQEQLQQLRKDVLFYRDSGSVPDLPKAQSRKIERGFEPEM